MQLWLLIILLLAVIHNYQQRKDDRKVSKHRNIGDELECLEPLDWHQYEGAQHDVCILISTVILLSFNAYHLIHLFPNKY